jgi:BirA family transcriptional regulator, biotin operon repressor / biotin---[acetyl-CoA-carboxylase] ligase
MVSAMWDVDWDVRWFDEVDSTNTYVRDQARLGAPPGLVVVADHQTAGRGRLDRRWKSPARANLLASVLLRPQCDGADVHLCTGAVALAAADACRVVAGVAPVLKWPNDLLVAGSKLAGVLAEAEFSGGTLVAVVVGIGLNVAWPGPEGAGGTCLDDVGTATAPIDRRMLLDHLLGALAARAGSLDDPGGRRDLAREVRQACATLGQPVRVVLAREEFTGKAVAIDDAGRLVVETGSGPRRVTAGDVVHLRPA